MKQVRCLYCGFFCSKYGKTRTGRQQNMVKLVQEGNGGTAKNVILSL